MLESELGPVRSGCSQPAGMFLSKHSGWFRYRAAVLLSLQPDNWADLCGTPCDRGRSRSANACPVVLRARSTLGGRCPELIREKVVDIDERSGEAEGAGVTPPFESHVVAFNDPLSLSLIHI